MGCGSSKSTSAVAPMPMPEAWSDKQQEEDKVKGSKIATASIIRVKEVTGSCDSVLPVDSQYSSVESILKPTDPGPNGEGRNGSAKSTDSGLGKEQVDIIAEESSPKEADIITEKSSPVLKQMADVPGDKPEPELNIDGKQMKTPGLLGHRKRSHGRLPPVHPHSKHSLQNTSGTVTEKPDELEIILQKHVKFADVLINELPASPSIIKRPVSRGGVAFDINTNDEQVEARPQVRKPACVLKYSQHRRAAEVITHAELDEKQKAADQRRKEQEQMRLERIHAQQEKDRQVAEALAKFAAMQTGLRQGEKAAAPQQTRPKLEETEEKAVKTKSNAGVEKKAIRTGSKTERKATHAKVALKKPRHKGTAAKSTGTG